MIAEGDRLIEDVICPSMADFLRAVDGRRTVAAIAREEGLDENVLQAGLVEALEMSLLARVA